MLCHLSFLQNNELCDKGLFRSYYLSNTVSTTPPLNSLSLPAVIVADPITCREPLGRTSGYM